MSITKEQLQGQDYYWSDVTRTYDIHEFQPTRKLFDRQNGKQLVAMINCYSKMCGTLDLNECLEVEKLLQEHLPLGIKSEISVFNWLNADRLVMPNR